MGSTIPCSLVQPSQDPPSTVHQPDQSDLYELAGAGAGAVGFDEEVVSAAAGEKGTDGSAGATQDPIRKPSSSRVLLNRVN
jgi:hypothetical protein